MTWALWLAVPVGATSVAALAAWVRGLLARRAARPLTTQESVRKHGDYLAALVIPAGSASRRVPSDALGADRGDQAP